MGPTVSGFAGFQNPAVHCIAAAAALLLAFA
jgi:hypothetical protein